MVSKLIYNYRSMTRGLITKLVFSFIMLSLFSVFTHAQNDCKEKIGQAEKKFENGKWQEVVNLLEDCDKEEGALDLLAKTFFELEDTVSAKENIKKNLKLNGDFKPDNVKTTKTDYLSFFNQVKHEILADLESARKSTNTIVLISAAAVIVGVVVAVLLLSQ